MLLCLLTLVINVFYVKFMIKDRSRNILRIDPIIKSEMRAYFLGDRGSLYDDNSLQNKLTELDNLLEYGIITREEHNKKRIQTISEHKL